MTRKIILCIMLVLLSTGCSKSEEKELTCEERMKEQDKDPEKYCKDGEYVQSAIPPEVIMSEVDGVTIYETKYSNTITNESDNLQKNYTTSCRVIVDAELYGANFKRLALISKNTLASISDKQAKIYGATYEDYNADSKKYFDYGLVFKHNSIEITSRNILNYVSSVLRYSGLDLSHVKAIYMDPNGIISGSDYVEENYFLMGEYSSFITLFKRDYKSSDENNMTLDFVDSKVYLNNYLAEFYLMENYIKIVTPDLTIEGEFMQNPNDGTLIIQNENEKYEFEKSRV